MNLREAFDGIVDGVIKHPEDSDETLELAFKHIRLDDAYDDELPRGAYRCFVLPGTLIYDHEWEPPV